MNSSKRNNILKYNVSANYRGARSERAVKRYCVISASCDTALSATADMIGVPKGLLQTYAIEELLSTLGMLKPYERRTRHDTVKGITGTHRGFERPNRLIKKQLQY